MLLTNKYYLTYGTKTVDIVVYPIQSPLFNVKKKIVKFDKIRLIKTSYFMKYMFCFIKYKIKSKREQT